MMVGFLTVRANIVLLNFGLAQCQHLHDVEPANKAFLHVQSKTEAAQMVAMSISDRAQRQILKRRSCETGDSLKKINKMLISQVEVIKRGVFCTYSETEH